MQKRCLATQQVQLLLLLGLVHLREDGVIVSCTGGSCQSIPTGCVQCSKYVCKEHRVGRYFFLGGAYSCKYDFASFFLFFFFKVKNSAKPMQGWQPSVSYTSMGIAFPMERFHFIVSSLGSKDTRW